MPSVAAKKTRERLRHCGRAALQGRVSGSDLTRALAPAPAMIRRRDSFRNHLRPAPKAGKRTSGADEAQLPENPKQRTAATVAPDERLLIARHPAKYAKKEWAPSIS